jgi:hypothetical protein
MMPPSQAGIKHSKKKKKLADKNSVPLITSYRRKLYGLDPGVPLAGN